MPVIVSSRLTLMTVNSRVTVPPGGTGSSEKVFSSSSGGICPHEVPTATSVIMTVIETSILAFINQPSRLFATVCAEKTVRIWLAEPAIIPEPTASSMPSRH